jgi:hypothetical protein
MKDRSIFWPLVLIAAGTLWLLISLGQLPQENLWALTYTFPYLLILLGFGLILRAYWRSAGMLVSVLVIAGAVLAVLYAPQLGWTNMPDWAWISPSGIGGSIAGSRNIESESRSVSDFKALSVDYPAEITIKQGDREALTLTADDNLLPQLQTEVRNGRLSIENNERTWGQRVRPSQTVEIVITVVDLEEIDFSTAGKLLVDGLQTEELDIALSGAADMALEEVELEMLVCRLSGAGNINASGRADIVELRLSGFGNFDGSDLESLAAGVRISGAGNATLWVQEFLEASISGAGSVRYYGEPSVERNISGAGSISSLGEKD